MQVKRGNILDETHDTLIAIPVNRVGVAGAGLAKAWASANPRLETIYEECCHKDSLKQTCVIGAFWMFPTKNHWKDKSDYRAIIARMNQDLMYFRERSIGSFFDAIAIPKLGCGLGGLNWDILYPALADQILDFEQDSEIEFIVYA